MKLKSLVSFETPCSQILHKYVIKETYGPEVEVAYLRVYPKSDNGEQITSDSLDSLIERGLKHQFKDAYVGHNSEVFCIPQVKYKSLILHLFNGKKIGWFNMAVITPKKSSPVWINIFMEVFYYPKYECDGLR